MQKPIVLIALALFATTSVLAQDHSEHFRWIFLLTRESR